MAQILIIIAKKSKIIFSVFETLCQAVVDKQLHCNNWRLFVSIVYHVFEIQNIILLTNRNFWRIDLYTRAQLFKGCITLFII